jgi:hypothetical protein
MLNSKDKIVRDFKDFFKVLGIDMELYNKTVIIRENLFSKKIIIHIIIAVLALDYVYSIRAHLYFAPLLILFAIIGYVLLWEDFKSINIIEFDLLNKLLIVKNRSIVRRWVSQNFSLQPAKYSFEDCRGVEIVSDKKNLFYGGKWAVNIKLRNGTYLDLIGFPGELTGELNAIIFSKLVAVLID